jgi:hypothetical protein
MKNLTSSSASFNQWQGYEHHQNFRVLHKDIISSKVTLPIPQNDWFIKMDYMCHELHPRWPAEIRSSYWNMFKLKFDKPRNQGRNYFQSIGVKGVGGQLNFEDIRTNNLYKINNVTYFPGITLAPDCYWPEMNPAHLMFAFGTLYEWGLHPPPNLPIFDRLSLVR